MNKPMHPNNITGEILLFLAKNDGEWCTWGKCFYMPTVQGVFRVGTKEKTQLRFMQILQRKGFVGGCDCGCRGDYTPTEKGLQYVAEQCISGEGELKRWQREKFSYGY